MRYKSVLVMGATITQFKCAYFNITFCNDNQVITTAPLFLASHTGASFSSCVLPATYLSCSCVPASPFIFYSSYLVSCILLFDAPPLCHSSFQLATYIYTCLCEKSLHPAQSHTEDETKSVISIASFFPIFSFQSSQ